MKKTPKRISLVAASAAVAVALAIGPAAAAGAAQKDFSYNCSGYNALNLSSKALHTVGHYRNGSLVASWNNGTMPIMVVKAASMTGRILETPESTTARKGSLPARISRSI